jgi:hypothetical protein
LKNKTDKDGYEPEIFYNGQYRSGLGNATNGGLFFEDSISAMSFFDEVETTQTTKFDYLSKVRLIFSVRLDKITPSGMANVTAQRLDDQAMWDVAQWIQATKCSNFNVVKVEKNIDKVYDRYNGKFKADALNKNMQPRFSFRIDLEVRWNPFLYNAPQTFKMEPVEHTIVLLIKTTPDNSALIQVGDGRYIQQQYAPGNTLKPMKIGDSNGHLAGRSYIVPFIYSGANVVKPTYNAVTGVWDRTAFGGFNDGDEVAIKFLDDYGAWVMSGSQI